MPIRMGRVMSTNSNLPFARYINMHWKTIPIATYTGQWLTYKTQVLVNIIHRLEAHRSSSNISLTVFHTPSLPE